MALLPVAAIRVENRVRKDHKVPKVIPDQQVLRVRRVLQVPKVLKDYKSDLLTITPEEEPLGFKYVYQTKLTKDTVNERLRGPLGLFDTKETFIDNNIQLVLDRLREYYA